MNTKSIVASFGLGVLAASSVMAGGLITGVTGSGLVPPAAYHPAGTAYDQQPTGSGNAYSSQNDTTGGNGNFATVYDNFTLASSGTITQVLWDGEYFNPPSAGIITGWTVSFWNDAMGQPGSLAATFPVGGNGNETFLGNWGGFPAFSYDVPVSFAATGGTQYWLSVVPDLGFPPQWGWADGNPGDGVSYQDFFGGRSPLAADMAFGLNVVPEPGASALVAGLGLVGFSLSRRMRK